jgi:hypothetical protein
MRGVLPPESLYTFMALFSSDETIILSCLIYLFHNVLNAALN